LRGQIEATEGTIKAESDLLAILRKQYDLGQVSMADVAAQEAALAQARLALPALEKQLDAQRDSLMLWPAATQPRISRAGSNWRI